MKIFTPTAEELAEVLRLHKLWLDGGEAGKRAILDGARLVRARLDGASLPTGEKWEQYLAEVLPALIKSGGKSVEEVVAKSWNCHEWTNCPMAEAFGVHKESETPILLQPRVRQFIQLFDARLIVAEQQPDGTYLFKSKPQVEAPAVVEGAK